MKSDLNDVAVFNEVVSAGSFSAAARHLGVPPSAVSRRVARLEERLGARLLHRTTRKLSLTEAGRIYHEQTAGISVAVAEAEQALAQMSSEPRGLVRVTTPPDDGGRMWPVFAEFLDKFPHVDLQLIQTPRYVDLIEEGVDVAIRGERVPDSPHLSARRLADFRMVLVASPRYLERRATPQRVADLAEHDCILADWASPRPVWTLQDADGSVTQVPLTSRVRVSDMDTGLRAALAHHGITWSIETNCARELATGLLVEVLPGAMGPPGPVWAISPVRRHRAPAVRAMVDHLAEAFPRVLNEWNTGARTSSHPLS